MQRMAMLWLGPIVDIPAGWALCDGNNGTPDLRDCIVIGAGLTYNPGDSFTTNIATNAGFTLKAYPWIMKVP